ncbi:MAG: hypothetical protein AAGM16_08875 [Pseudomonadota bacterium]
MRIMTIALLIVAILAPAITQADERAESAIRSFAESRKVLQSTQEEILREEMRFTDEENTAFWPVYRDYAADMHIVRDQQTEIIATYLEAYWAGTVTEPMAEGFVEDYLAVKAQLVKVQRKHLKAFRRVLPPLKVARLYQLETKLESDVNAQLALYVPLIEAE